MNSFDEIIKLIGAFISIAFILMIGSLLLSQISQMQIQPYLQQLEEKDREIAVLKEQINQLQNEK